LSVTRGENEFACVPLYAEILAILNFGDNPELESTEFEKGYVLKDWDVVRSSGPRLLFLMTAGITVLLMLWSLLLSQPPGLTLIFTVLFAADYSATLCALLILVAAVFLSPHVPARRLLSFAGNNAVAIALGSAVVLAAGTLFVYHDHPLSMDEYAAYFQSRVFAAGRLHGQFPPGLLDWLIPPGFQDYFLNVSPATGAVSETYWPGFALLLTPFTWARVPWLCNPVISALTLLVIHRLALAIFADRDAAGLALLLTLASPVIFADGISYYSMPAHLLANCLYALLLLRPTVLRAGAAGVVGSWALSLHNPVPHLLFAVPWVIWIATRRDRIKLLAALGAGYLPLCVLLGVGWFLFSSQLLVSGLVHGASSAAAPDRLHAMLAIFTPPSLAVLLARAIGIAKVWIWAVPGLLVLAVVGAVRWRQDTACRLLTASALLTVFGYFFVPVDQGHGWGYRYFHSAWAALPLLATAAVFPPAWCRGESRDPAALAPFRFEDTSTKCYITTCIILSLVLGIGLRAWQIEEFIARDLRQIPPYKGTERHVVIIDPRLSFYGADLVQNDPWLRGVEIRMLSRGATADALMMARNFPTMHRVYSDYRGSVWSARATQETQEAGSAPRSDP
jgi:hypothetical protein